MLFLVGIDPHSPNVILTFHSGMVGIGGLFILGGGYLPGTIPQAFGALSVLLAFVNVSGGFVITKRMLDMFKRKAAREPGRFSSLTVYRTN
jgi:H+-translocating NAD(P) transhydrogenase